MDDNELEKRLLEILKDKLVIQIDTTDREGCDFWYTDVSVVLGLKTKDGMEEISKDKFSIYPN